MELFIPGPAGKLEAVYWPASGERARAAAVMCHPHPLHGGTMNSSVVFRASRGLQLAGVDVLRFNFRGAGRSEGVHDGRGGELEDLRAALDWLDERSSTGRSSGAERTPDAPSGNDTERSTDGQRASDTVHGRSIDRSDGIERWVGGFSFGSRTAAALAVDDERVARVVLIALPVKAFDCSFVRRLAKPGLIVTAEHDEYGGRSDLLARFPDLHPGLEIVEIPGTGHFFEGATHELQRLVRDWAQRTLAART